MTLLDKAEIDGIADAQLRTLDWLDELGANTGDVASELDRDAARRAFGAITTQRTPEEEQRAALVALKTPSAVRHITGMLTAYDWEFVEQAKELRGYTVAKIVEETKSPNAQIRLKALQMLGKVTEVGLFTDKIEVKKTEMSDFELETRIKDKLNRFMGVVDVIEVVKGDDGPAEPDDAQQN